MIVLDTTVLLYAIGDDHPLRRPCSEVLDAIGDGQLTATTTVEVIQEFAHVRARRRGRAEAAARAVDYLALLSPLLQPSEADLAGALCLFAHHERLGMFDAVLAAATIGSVQATGLMSADKAFARIPKLTYLAPGRW